MTDIALDQGGFYPSPLTGWYRERPFKVALVGSLLVHAALIAAVPGFRAVVIEVPQVLNVEILKEELPQPVVPAPVRRQPELRPEVVQAPPVVEPLPPPVAEPLAPPPVLEKPAIRPEPKVRQPEPVVSPPDPVVRSPEPVVRQPAPDVPPAPKTEVIQMIPRPEQRPDPVVVPKPVPQPAPNLEPRAQVQPESPVPRVAPPPQPALTVQPQIAAVTPPQKHAPQPKSPVPRVAPPPQPAPTVQPQIAAVTPPQRDAPQPAVPQASVQAPAVVAPAPPVQAARTEPAAERTLTSSYEKSLADLIKRHEKYPDRARRQGWQGTAVVGLSLSADGKVKDISIIESSGRDILDEAALNMVRRASPLPRAPEGLRGTARTVRVPIVFKLQDS